MKTRTVMLSSAWEAGPRADAAKLYARRALLDALRKGEAPVSAVALWGPLAAEHRVAVHLEREVAAQLDAWVFYIDTVDALLLANFRTALQIWNVNVPHALRDNAIEFRAFERRQAAARLDPAEVLRTRTAFGQVFRAECPVFASAWGCDV